MTHPFTHCNQGSLGDQDWATLVGMAAPQLIYPLSCMFNRQIGLPSRVLLKLNKDFYLCEDFEQVRPTVISCSY